MAISLEKGQKINLEKSNGSKLQSICVGVNWGAIVTKGFLGAKKGKGGGYYLIKEPKDINMAKVYRILEGPIALLPCASHNFYEPCDDCNDEATCAVRKLMMEVRDNTLMILENNTLADIAF